MHHSLAAAAPSFEDFDRFFGDEGVLRALAGAMHEDALVTFELTTCDGTRAWTLHKSAGTVQLAQPLGSGTDCTLSCSGSDFRALLAGELTPRQGFLDRRLCVQGDVGIVLQLRKAVRHLGATD